MQNAQNLTVSRRGILAGSIGAALAVAEVGFSCRAAAQAPQPAIQLSLSYITRRPELSVAEFRTRYEQEHVIRAVRAMTTIRRYVRNYVDGAIGVQPDFDVISEFGFPIGDSGVDVCGHQIDPNWIKSRSGRVSEIVVSGTPWSFENGPVHKRAILVRRSRGGDFETALSAFAQTTARQLGGLTNRILLNLAQVPLQDTFACVESAQVCDATLTAWPKPGAMLPDRFTAPPGLQIHSILDLAAYASDVPVKA
jgi:hypothetical protein